MIVDKWTMRVIRIQVFSYSLAFLPSISSRTSFPVWHLLSLVRHSITFSHKGNEQKKLVFRCSSVPNPNTRNKRTKHLSNLKSYKYCSVVDSCANCCSGALTQINCHELQVTLIHLKFHIFNAILNALIIAAIFNTSQILEREHFVLFYSTTDDGRGTANDESSDNKPKITFKEMT